MNKIDEMLSGFFDTGVRMQNQFIFFRRQQHDKNWCKKTTTYDVYNKTNVS